MEENDDYDYIESPKPRFIKIYKDNILIGKINAPVDNSKSRWLLKKKIIELRDDNTYNLISDIKELSKYIEFNKTNVDIPDEVKSFEIYHNDKLLGYKTANVVKFLVKRGYGEIVDKNKVNLLKSPPEDIIFQDIPIECSICKSKDSLNYAYMFPKFIMKYMNISDIEKYIDKKFTKLKDSRILICCSCFNYYVDFESEFAKIFNKRFPQKGFNTDEEKKIYYDDVIQKIKDNEGIDKFIENYIQKFCEIIQPKWIPVEIKKLISSPL